MEITKNQQKKEKLKELIWYICENYNQQLFETKLWKLAFFCDADYFQKYNESITSVPYIKNARGPTPVFNIAKLALAELISDGYITRAENDTYVATKDYKVKYLDNQKIDAINTTCDIYYKLNVKQICTLAHRDPVYLAAENINDILDFSFVAYRDDGAHDDDDSEDIPKVVSFSQKAKDNLFKLASA